MLVLSMAALSAGLGFFVWRAARIQRTTRDRISEREQAALAFAEQVRWEHCELERSLECGVHCD